MSPVLISRIPPEVLALMDDLGTDRIEWDLGGSPSPIHGGGPPTRRALYERFRGPRRAWQGTAVGLYHHGREATWRFCVDGGVGGWSVAPPRERAPSR